MTVQVVNTKVTTKVLLSMLAIFCYRRNSIAYQSGETPDCEELKKSLVIFIFSLLLLIYFLDSAKRYISNSSEN
jgi:hypothetical protein